MARLKKYVLLGLSYLMLVSPAHLSAHSGHGKIKEEKGDNERPRVVVITSQFIMPAKLTLLQGIASSEGLQLEGHIYPPSDEENPESWLIDADLVILDTPRRGLRLMSGIQEMLAETSIPWIFPRGGKVTGENLQPDLKSTLNAYYRGGGKENFSHLLVYIQAWKSAQATDDIPPPVELPVSGYYHSQAETTFETLENYLAWGKARWSENAPVLAIAISPDAISDGQTAVYDHLIEQIEKADAVPLLFWYDRNHPKAVSDKIAAAKPVLIVNMTHMISADRKQELSDLNVPVVIGLGHRGSDMQQWREDAQGVVGGRYATLMVIPESWGMSDPVVLSAVENGAPVAIREQVDLLIGRFKKLAKLQQAKRDELKLSFLFWNSPSGEKNLSASNLNVPRSIENILSELAKQGYDVAPKNEEEIIKQAQNLLAAYYRPETLDALLADGNAAVLPLRDYKKWLSTLPAKISTLLQQTWGEPEGHWSVRKIEGEDSFVIPRAQLGNLVLLPQPPRADIVGRNTHDKIQPPGHFYLAVYLYLREHFQSDAIIHFGTHGNQEWLPGKDRGLWAYDYPNLAVGNVPVFYPYIQDNTGEAMQAKRRGRATTISHQTPPFAPSGFYDDLSVVHDLMHQYRVLEEGAVRKVTLDDLLATIFEFNFHKDLDWTEGKVTEEIDAFILVLDEHLHRLSQATTPIGLHTFGESAAEEYRTATVMQQLGTDYYQALNIDTSGIFSSDFEALFTQPAYTYLLPYIRGDKQAGEAKTEVLQEMMQTAILSEQRLENNNELAALMKGLRGEFVEPGPGGDPVRNPQTSSGTNLFALDPEKIPSPAAYQAAEKSFQELAADYRKNNNGEALDKLAVSLWSSETIRTLGLSEAQVMHALGVRPVWNKGGKVTSLEIIPRSELGRPRVDVLLQATSVYRDQFDGIMRKLALVIEALSELDEAQNPIAANSRKVAHALQETGLEPEMAKRYAQARIFSNPPGDYGTGVTSLAMDSTRWEDNSVLADQFINSQSNLYSSQDWGVPIGDMKLLELQLDGVDAVMLSRSSNLHGLLSTDHPYEYLGGLSASVKKVSGKNPALYISNSRTENTEIISAKRFLSNELRTHYQNPQWINGMQKEGYAGTVSILRVVNNLFGWQAIDSNMVRADQWQEIHETYVMDQRDLNINEWFAEHNATAQVQLIERMMEAIRKDYWDASEETRKQLIARWQTLVNEFDGQAGAAKTQTFMENQAVGFGLAWSQTDAEQSSQDSAETPSKNVQGQVLEEVKPDAQDQPIPWAMWLAFLVLAACVLSGLLTPLYQVRKAEKHRV
ncbi:MAG: cobaltochelatase subunit CobN [Pseudomonadales bacterium]|nr:cobaltochelatase subunit CobN [Pseudomonadales bacterium]